MGGRGWKTLFRNKTWSKIMITHTEEERAYYDDGRLMYECTYAYIAPLFAHLYEDGGIRMKCGTIVIRINHATRYLRDGSVQWKLIYDEFGRVVDNYDSRE